MSSVTDSPVSSVAHPVQYSCADVQSLISSGCSEKLVSELIHYNKATYQAYVSVLHAVTNPGGSNRASSSGVHSSRSSLLSASSASTHASAVLRRNLSPVQSRSGFGFARMGSAGDCKIDSVPCPSGREGYCYTKLFRASRVESISSVLGTWPALSTILSQPVRDFRALSSIGGLSLYKSSPGCHIDVSGLGSGGLPVLDALRALSVRSNFPSGSLGRELSTSPGTLIASDGISLDTKVGGGGVRLLFLEVKAAFMREFTTKFSQYRPFVFGSTVFFRELVRQPLIVPDEWFIRGFRKTIIFPVKAGVLKFGSSVIETDDVYGTLHDFAMDHSVVVGCTDFGLDEAEVYSAVGTDEALRSLQRALVWKEVQRSETSSFLVRDEFSPEAVAAAGDAAAASGLTDARLDGVRQKLLAQVEMLSGFLFDSVSGTSGLRLSVGQLRAVLRGLDIAAELLPAASV